MSRPINHSQFAIRYSLFAIRNSQTESNTEGKPGLYGLMHGSVESPFRPFPLSVSKAYIQRKNVLSLAHHPAGNLLATQPHGSMKRFDELFAELQHKAVTRDPNSGTVKALAQGKHAIGKKILEEAGEVWMAAEYEGREKTAEEICKYDSSVV